MATGLYIASTAGYSGKNMIIMGLGLLFQKLGLNVGYMKPVGAMPKEKDFKLGDEDAFFVRDILNLHGDPTLITPVVVTHDFIVKSFSGNANKDMMPAIKEAYETLSQGKDIMLVAGSGSMYSGRYCGLDGIRMASALGLKTILIDRYFQKELDYDFILALKDQLSGNMAGVIFNDIPPSYMNEAETLIKPFLEKNGINVLAVIPRDPLMGAINVSDLADRLGGKLISAHTKSDRIVENFLIGTMQVENFLTHFRKNKNAAIIVGGDRSDVLLIALEGNCPCLVLTGNLYPTDIILKRAETSNVPIIVVREDTYTVAKRMEAILSSHKLRDVIKIKHGAQLVSSCLDLPTLKKELGLP